MAPVRYRTADVEGFEIFYREAGLRYRTSSTVGGIGRVMIL